jgi:hypothetical protein
MNYTWKITGLKKTDSSDIKNIVVQTYWKKIGTDENGNEGTFNGATPFEISSIDPNNFISYENLTEELIIGWIQSVVVGEYELHVNKKIQKQIDDKVSPTIEVTGGFPWETQVSTILPS